MLFTFLASSLRLWFTVRKRINLLSGFWKYIEQNLFSEPLLFNLDPTNIASLDDGTSDGSVAGHGNSDHATGDVSTGE